MKYTVITSEIVEHDWLVNNFGGPHVPMDLYDYQPARKAWLMENPNVPYVFLHTTSKKGYFGPGWQVWRQRHFCKDSFDHQWSTLGIFDKVEPAVLFKLRWL